MKVARDTLEQCGQQDKGDGEKYGFPEQAETGVEETGGAKQEGWAGEAAGRIKKPVKSCSHPVKLPHDPPRLNIHIPPTHLLPMTARKQYYLGIPQSLKSRLLFVP